MINSIDIVVKHLIALTKAKRTSKRQLFGDHIEPLQQALEEATTDFLYILNSAKEQISDDDGCIFSTVFKAILQRLYEGWMKRWKIKDYGDAIFEDESFPEPIREYAKSVRDFFNGTSCYVDRRHSAALQNILAHVGSWEAEGFKSISKKKARTYCIVHMSRMEEHLKESIRDISAEYYHLKVSLQR